MKCKGEQRMLNQAAKEKVLTFPGRLETTVTATTSTDLAETTSTAMKGTKTSSCSKSETKSFRTLAPLVYSFDFAVILSSVSVCIGAEKASLERSIWDWV
ncbi:hypothetical protein FH972_020121 [Carpinus fangiana]|uniref:Uncharacterized protein n=1 Tax=Carpinus fangiana TaxID=176857 RepID=A0A5N6RS82_9ROSI|nr:hypothetical protein FH972_020121 [Carpinus fangiana]